MPIEKMCVNCVKPYKVRPSREKSKYCSQKCSIEHQRGENTHTWRGGKKSEKCNYCGKEFDYWPSYRHSCMNKTWSQEEEAILVKMHTEKKTFTEIASTLNKSVQAVKSKCYQTGLAYKKKWSKKDIEILKEKHKEGVLGEDIAKLLNTTRASIEWQITKLGIGAAPGSEEFSKKASIRNKKLWDNPEHIFNQPEYRGKLSAKWKDPNSLFNSEEYRQALSDRAKENKIGLSYSFCKNRGNYKGGYRPDLGFYVRSGWEANIARYLKFLVQKDEIKGFKYEADTFDFFEIKKGTRSYTPDFKIFNNDGNIEYWEVKGYMDQKSKTQLMRMAKYYHHINIKIIEKKQYNEIKKWSRLIVGWDDEGLDIIAEKKLEIIRFLEEKEWFVVSDIPYQLCDETCVGVIQIMALKERRHIFIEVVPNRFINCHIKSRFQQDLEAAGGTYVLCRGIEDLKDL